MPQREYFMCVTKRNPVPVLPFLHTWCIPIQIPPKHEGILEAKESLKGVSIRCHVWKQTTLTSREGKGWYLRFISKSYIFDFEGFLKWLKLRLFFPLVITSILILHAHFSGWETLQSFLSRSEDIWKRSGMTDKLSGNSWGAFDEESILETTNWGITWLGNDSGLNRHQILDLGSAFFTIHQISFQVQHFFMTSSLETYVASKCT